LTDFSASARPAHTIAPVKKTNGTLRRWEPLDVFGSLQEDLECFWLDRSRLQKHVVSGRFVNEKGLPPAMPFDRHLMQKTKDLRATLDVHSFAAIVSRKIHHLLAAGSTLERLR